MQERDSDFETLAKLSSAGDQTGMAKLMGKYRPSLRKMVAARLDPRLASRVDASDVVQETMIEAVQKLNDYLQNRPLPFYPWLRQLAVGRIANLTREHIQTQRRSITREDQVELGLSDESVVHLANNVIGRHSSPSQQAMRGELQDTVRAALARLSQMDREVLILRFVEQLSAKDTATILGITPESVGMRRLRALQRLDDELKGTSL